MNRLLHSKISDKKNQYRNSLSVIWVGFFVSLASAIYISTNYYFPIAPIGIINYLGLALIVFGVGFRLIIIKSLGEFFTADVTIKQDHKLKTTGFYGFLRHPAYFASLLSFTGFGISLNNWLALAIIAVVLSAVFAYYIKVEEKALLENFELEYLATKNLQKV